MSERMSLLEFLKERSGIRLSKLEAYLDLVDKASVQYIPKDLCKQEFSLSNGQFVITITELAGCWHWHRATVRTFIEQLEKMNQISVTRLTKSQIITIPMLAETPAVSPIDAALDVFRQKMRTALDEWRSGKMSASACASECEQLYEDATEEVAIILQKADNGNSIGKVPCGSNIPESVGHAFCMTALTAVCEATFHQVLSQETDNALATSLLPFFYKDLGGDWLSFIEAAKAISELALDGSSPALQLYTHKRKLVMATPKQVMDFRPSKGITTAQSNEHQRRWTEKGWGSAEATGNYDRSRERLNFEIRGGKVYPIDKSRSIPERMADILRSRGIKDPNEGLAEPRFRTVVNFIFGGSRERMTELAFGDQKVDLTHGADNSHLTRCKDIEEWAKDVYRFVADKYGEENIAIKDGKFAYKQIFAGKDKYEFSARMKALHSEFAEVNKRWGMERGTSVSETGARHRTTEEYRRQLSEQCTTIEQSVAAHQRTLASLQSDIRLAERRVKGLTSMVNNLLQEKAEKEAALAELHRQILAGHDNPDALRQQVQELEQELSAIQSKLDDKKEKLSEADRKLDALREEMTAMKERTEELRQEAHRYSDTIRQGADTVLRNALLENMVSEFSERVARLSNEGKDVFDDSLLQAFAENGTEVMYCATLLFLGYVDDATTFAEGHGGGGSSSDLKWGRDDDEDERAWARRCMMKAARMMRPSSGKKKKR